MRVLRLYAPAIVLLLWSILAAVGVSPDAAASYLVLAVAVWLHVSAEARREG